MPLPVSNVKNDRFALYNRDLAKNPTQTSDYPRMLTSSADGTTTVVQDATDHKKLVGVSKFENEPFWGPSGSAKAAPASAETTQVDGFAASLAPNEIAIPEKARSSKDLKLKALNGKGTKVSDLVPPQTTFDSALPDPDRTLKNPSLGGRPEFKGS